MSTTQKAKSVLLLLVVIVLQLLSFFCHHAVVVVASSAFILLSVAHNIYCDALSFNVRFGWVEDAPSATHTLCIRGVESGVGSSMAWSDGYRAVSCTRRQGRGEGGVE